MRPNAEMFRFLRGIFRPTAEGGFPNGSESIYRRESRALSWRGLWEGEARIHPKRRKSLAWLSKEPLARLSEEERPGSEARRGRERGAEGIGERGAPSPEEGPVEQAEASQAQLQEDVRSRPPPAGDRIADRILLHLEGSGSGEPRQAHAALRRLPNGTPA